MIKYGISELGVIPVRKQGNEQSEMITQILFGETFIILEENPKWSYIKIIYDDYEGWISSNSITLLQEDSFNQINSGFCYNTSNFTDIILNEKNEKTIIPFGSTLPNYDIKNNSFKIINNYKLQNTQTIDNHTDIITLSYKLLNIPYLWGGKNPFGMDCSGFIQLIYKVSGKKLPRDANQQVLVGENINFISEANPGDLAFFDNQDGNITHVGIILNNNRIIHASGKVRIDNIDQQGIFNIQMQKYTHKLRVVKRIN